MTKSLSDKIDYSEFFLFKGMYSTYEVGVVTREWIEHMNDIQGYDLWSFPTFESHGLLFEMFMKRHLKTMWDWLMSNQINFAGFLDVEDVNKRTFSVRIAFRPGSHDELMFRLRFSMARK